MTGCEGGVKKGTDGKWVAPCILCPVHIGLHAKALQARDAGVSPEELKAPVFSKVARLAKVPAGVTLVVDESERDDVLQQTNALVLVITREQEVQGLRYDGSQPFLLNGRKFRPPPRGVWFVVPGKGYAVFAWASAAGVTHRMRKLLRKANARSEVEVVPEKTIEKLSSRSVRIGMATLLSRNGVPMEEIVANGEWEDEAMCRTYVRSHAPLAVQRRNLPDVIFSPGTGAGAVQSTGVGVGTCAGTLQVAGALLAGAAEDMGTSDEQGDGAVQSGLAVSPVMGAVALTAAPKKNKERPEYRPCHPELWVKGMVFKRENVAGDSRLRALLHKTAGDGPLVVQKALCAAGYHVTRKEIANYRERMALQATVAPEVSESELMLAVGEEMQGA